MGIMKRLFGRKEKPAIAIDISPVMDKKLGELYVGAVIESALSPDFDKISKRDQINSILDCYCRFVRQEFGLSSQQAAEIARCARDKVEAEVWQRRQRT